MKEPWEFFFESVEHDVGGRARPESPVDPESDEAGAFLAAFRTARISTSYFLIRDLSWMERTAAHLVHGFFKTSRGWLDDAQNTGLPGLKERLRNCYTDWMLQ